MIARIPGHFFKIQPGILRSEVNTESQACKDFHIPVRCEWTCFVMENGLA